jgi:hypothetical protein
MVRQSLQRRVRTLEEQAPRKDGGTLIAILPDGMSLEEFRVTLKPWYTPQGERREPVIVFEDDRPSAPIPFGTPKARPSEPDYDYGDDEESV